MRGMSNQYIVGFDNPSIIHVIRDDGGKRGYLTRKHP